MPASLAPINRASPMRRPSLVWAFVAPGLYRHEKRLAAPIIFSSVLMFFLGMAYCYFVVFGFVFKFVAGFAPDSVAVAPDIEAYFGFVLGMFLAFGLTFEVPIAVVLLVRFGIASVEKLKQARPYVIVGAFIVAAIFTPPDVLSQLLLAIPLCLLYELGLQLARFVAKPKEEDRSFKGPFSVAIGWPGPSVKARIAVFVVDGGRRAPMDPATHAHQRARSRVYPDELALCLGLQNPGRSRSPQPLALGRLNLPGFGARKPLAAASPALAPEAVPAPADPGAGGSSR